jgi:hypothetical protein
MLLFDKKLTIDSISDYIDCKIDQSNVHTITQLMSSSEINKKFKDYVSYLINLATERKVERRKENSTKQNIIFSHKAFR